MKKGLIFSISYFPFVGGAEVAVKEITDRIDFDFDMITCLFDRKLSRFEKIGNINIYRINCPKILFPFFAFFKAIKLSQKKEYDFSWSIMTYAGFAGLFLKIFKPKIKFILNLQEGTPINSIKRKAFFVYPLFYLMFKMADKIHALSSFLAYFGKSMGHKKEILVIPNGVDLDFFRREIEDSKIQNLKEKLQKKDGDVYLITTSRLVYKNAVDDVIKALKYLPENVHFIVLGVGEEEQKLRILAKEIGVRDRVKFLGLISKEDIPLFLKVSDIFIRVSRSEGFGVSFAEAMAMGLPVIASPVGGIPDFISDMQTGIFASPNSPKSIAEKIKMLLNDKDLMYRIGQNGKELVFAKYGFDLIAEEIKNKVFI